MGNRSVFWGIAMSTKLRIEHRGLRVRHKLGVRKRAVALFRRMGGLWGIGRGWLGRGWLGRGRGWAE